MVGGGSTETLNPNEAAGSDIDITRMMQLYDWLVYPGPKGEPQLHLAEVMEPNASATEWTIRLRSGVEFHNGKPLTADDLMYSLRWIANPKSASVNAAVLSYMDLKSMKKLDKLTVRVPTTFPNAQLIGIICNAVMAVIPEGTTSFAKPNGTGPFKFVSWTPGQSSLFKRNPNYFISGTPYVDELEMLSIPDNSARLNALLGGTVDAVDSIGYAEAAAFKAQGSNAPINPLIANTPGIIPITMGFVSKPFRDVRVRTAFKLIVNRKQMISQVQSGLGEIGNDIYGLGLPFYDSSLPQRTQDIEKAKSLLKKAGYENLTVTLSSSRVVSGMLESATLFAQQASQAGVKVNVRNLPPATYFSTGYPNYPFGQDNWQCVQLANFYTTSLAKNAPYNDSQWHDSTNYRLIKRRWPR